MANIAIIGAGFFGTTIAIRIKEKYPNFNIDLFDKNKEILFGTSGKNQFRCHQGYHYPRSIKTFIECASSLNSFDKMFSKTYMKSNNFYAISKYNSMTSFDDYIKYLDNVGLFYKIQNNPLLNKNMIDGIVKVKEKILNINKARKILNKSLINHNINLYLNNDIDLKKEFMNKYDKIIIATYENNNQIKKKLNLPREKYFYQLVEKVIVKTPKHYNHFSCVVIDGDFMSIDPYLKKSFHVLGHVRKSVITENISKSGLKSNEIAQKLLNEYKIVNSKDTLFNNIKADFLKYFNNFEKTKYYESFYTVRCTKKNKSDERTTSIDFHGKFIFVHSGKWINCVEAANTLTNTL